MRVLIAVCIALVVAACGRSSTDSTASHVDCTTTGPTVSPPSVTLHPGDTLRATAFVHQCEGQPTSTTVRWRTSDTAVAGVDSLSGLVRARASGRSTIIASLVVNPQIEGAMALTVAP
jgi:uncharacterized protein YjdB